MLTKSHLLGVYSTIDFNAYPLLESTILDNRATIYLVNNIDLIKPRLFIKTSSINYIEVGT